MRKTIRCFTVLLSLVFSLPVFAEITPAVISPAQAEQAMICEGPPLGSPKSTAAICGMLIQDMTQIMTDSLTLQERVLKGAKPEEKKQMLREIDSMRAKLERLRSEARVALQGFQSPPCDDKQAGQ